jgi:hypothetical protein
MGFCLESLAFQGAQGASVGVHLSYKVVTAEMPHPRAAYEETYGLDAPALEPPFAGHNPLDIRTAGHSGLQG